MRPFDYVRAETVADAIAMLDRAGDGDPGSARLLAGGTDLLTLMKHEIAMPDRLIDIKRLPDLDDAITDAPDGVTIGALATLAELETHPLIVASFPALSQAAALAASPQLRNMATIGGNLLQRPRCWYYRSEHVDCWLKGGDDCPAREGENQHHALFADGPCVAVHPSDLATALLALDASVLVRGPQGDRTVPLESFFAQPVDERRTETTLARDEIVLAVTLPHVSEFAKSGYRKAMDRKVWSFALVGVGVRLVMDGDRISDARIALGGVAPVPRRVPEAEAMLVDGTLGAELFERVAGVALARVTPLEKNGYKVPLLRALLRRALTEIAM